MEIFVHEVSFIIYKVSVAICFLNTPTEGMAFQRTPIALAANLIRGKCPRAIGTHQYEVGLVAFAQETAIFHLINLGWIMAHEFHKALDAEHTLVGESEHGW